MATANELKSVAEQHMAMTHTAYAVGEIDLIDPVLGEDVSVLFTTGGNPDLVAEEFTGFFRT